MDSLETISTESALTYILYHSQEGVLPGVAPIALSRPVLKYGLMAASPLKWTRNPHSYSSVRFNGVRAVSPQLIAGRVDAIGARFQLSKIDASWKETRFRHQTDQKKLDP